ncbi:hypothetical protein, partial [Pseudomonas syringae group genomosp. 7]|uniref:hypothetical protein n=1 Tax=Pseudomonas syringae group genomosp. 7 TaxID=251699 RepID=UPI0037705098
PASCMPEKHRMQRRTRLKETFLTDFSNCDSPLNRLQSAASWNGARRNLRLHDQLRCVHFTEKQ